MQYCGPRLFVRKTAKLTLISASEVIKQRIARPGSGKSKGYRTVILFRRGERAVFVYGFAKSQRANIEKRELQQFKEAAKIVLSMTERELAASLKRGDFTEVKGRE